VTAEQWKPIAGFPTYEVSSLGRVSRMRGGQRRILVGGCTMSGYRTVLLYNEGVRTPRRVHTLVAEHFIGPRPEGLEIRHLDGDQRNNAAANLAYGTHVENMQDVVRHGRNRNAAKTACPSGHPYSEANTYRNRRGSRCCRICQYEATKRSRVRRALRAANVPLAS
jgi:hypothetical protein